MRLTSLSPSLSGRQREVLFLICKGLRNSEVAAQLSISERTVKWHASQLFSIYGVTNRTELVGTLALEHRMFNGAD
jgi:DNA-binding CsgD family transcriptional regulator